VRPVNWQPGTADFAFQGSSASGNENASFVSMANFSQLVPTAGAGFRVAPNLRLGVALEGWWTSISQSLVVHDMIVGGTVQTLTRSYAINGSVAHAGVSGGVQWDLTPSWTFGAMVRSPGLRVFGSALVRYDTQLATGSKEGALTLRDEEADLDYKIPTHIGAGLARTFSRGAIELDIRYDASTSEYSLVSSDVTGTASVDSSGTVTTAVVSLSDVRNQAASVLGFAVGGHYAFSKALLLHAGFFSDPSPVEDQAKSFFRQVDILGFTTGLEMRGEKFSGSLGLGYNWGDSGPVRTGGLLGGQIISPSLKIHTLSLTYAVSFQF
jgi:long-subunit fatty acid transport protein